MPLAEVAGESSQTRAAREGAIAAARRSLRTADITLAQLDRLAALAGKAADDCARAGRTDAAAKWREALGAAREGRGLAAVSMLRGREALAALIEGWASGAKASQEAIRMDEARISDIWDRLGRFVKDIRKMHGGA
jgi:hypothetical protein